MKEVYKNLFVGNLHDCNNAKNMAIVHACKTPCHQRGVSYNGNLSSSHPNYLIKETDNDLYLNLVDMNRISPRFTDEPIKTALRFVDKHINNQQVLIHCNQGQSRSCSIAIVYLAQKNIISNDSYEEALVDFRKLYPLVNIGIGFNNYLRTNWDNLMRFKDE